MAAVDPRMFFMVWTDRLEYEALAPKRPAPTRGEVTSPVAKPAAKPVSDEGSSIQTEGKGLLEQLKAAQSIIRQSLENTTETTEASLLERASVLESSNTSLKKLIEDVTAQLERLEARVKSGAIVGTPAAPAKPAAKAEESDDDSFKFDDSDEEEDEAPKETEMQRMKRLAAEKKAKADAEKAAAGHQGPITKSNVIIDIKPWDDETDLGLMEKEVRAIKMEGLLWGASKLEEVGYGIKKLRIATTIVDHLVGLYDLEDNITGIEDYVQSVDIVAHNKI